MTKFRLSVPEVSYTVVEVEANTIEEAFENYYMGGDYKMVSSPEFSHLVGPDPDKKEKWSLVVEDGEDTQYVRVWSTKGKYVWVPSRKASEVWAGSGY